MTQDLSGMLGSLLGGKGGANLAPLIQAALAMFLKNNGGNLNGLMGQLQAGGLGEQAKSWVGGGPNEPVTGAQLTQALGQDKINELATEAGMSPQEAADGLAQTLPEAVNKLTPQGQIPDPAAVQQQLKSLLGG